MDGDLNNEGHKNDLCNQVGTPFSSFWQSAKNSLFFFWYFTCWIMLYMISSHILLVNCFYWCSFFLFFFYHQPKTVRLFLFFVFYWLNYSIHDFRATGASLDWKTWIHLNQNIWMIWMMMIGCQSQKKNKNSIVALAVKTLLAKEDCHASGHSCGTSCACKCAKRRTVKGGSPEFQIHESLPPD